jgi:serine/threonine protein kinase
LEIQAKSDMTPKLPPSTQAASFLSQMYTQTTFSLQQPDEEFQIGDVIGNYTLVREVGVGAFSKVYEAISVVKPDFIQGEQAKSTSTITQADIDQQKEIPTPTYSLAVKITSNPSRRSISRETQIWSRLKHPHILHLVELFQLDDVCVLVSELGDTSLLDHIRHRGSPGLRETDTRHYFGQICSALEYLHEQVGIIHHDIKLENILLKQNHIKLGDFGMAEEMVRSYEGQGGEIVGGDPNRHPIGCMGICCSNIGRQRTHMEPEREPTELADTLKELVLEPVSLPDQNACGSIHYLCPEDLCPPTQIMRLPTPACDMWALGCVLYAMLTGSLPFNDTFLPRLQMYILNAKFDTEKLDRYRVSDSAKDIILGLLTKETKDRWDIQRVLSSPFLQA